MTFRPILAAGKAGWLLDQRDGGRFGKGRAGCWGRAGVAGGKDGVQATSSEAVATDGPGERKGACTGVATGTQRGGHAPAEGLGVGQGTTATKSCMDTHAGGSESGLSIPSRKLLPWCLGACGVLRQGGSRGSERCPRASLEQGWGGNRAGSKPRSGKSRGHVLGSSRRGDRGRGKRSREPLDIPGGMESLTAPSVYIPALPWVCSLAWYR